MADWIDWDDLDGQFAALYASDRRPLKATRMMIELTLLQSLYGHSEDDSLGGNNKEGFILGAQGLDGNPYDDHTLKGTLTRLLTCPAQDQKVAMLIVVTEAMG